MARIMTKNSIRIRISTDQQGEQVFKALIVHPMETGQRRDYKTRNLIPADFIDVLRISVDDNLYLEMSMGENGSRNPFLSFVFSQPIYEGQHLQVSWIDNRKRTTSHDWVFKLNEKGIAGFASDTKGSEVVAPLPTKGPACKNTIRTRRQ